MTLLSGTNLGVGQLVLRTELLGSLGYRLVALHKDSQEFLGNFRLVGGFGPVGEFRPAGERGVDYSEGGFAEKNPSELIIGINGDG